MSDERVVTKRYRKGKALRVVKERAGRWASIDSYGRLFETGRQDELRRALVAKVHEGLPAPDGGAIESICRAVDEVISEREWGWHFALPTERLLKRGLRADDASALLCADCALPRCCYFDIVRLTPDDVARLSKRLEISSKEFVAQHCTPFVDAQDRRYAHALKKAKPCEFLGEDDRCRVYADRPTVCADFPLVVDPTTGDITEIRLFPFCNVPFNVVRHEVTRRFHDCSG
ncbi:MAG: YkgJ family cysteine cluster protein [Euryarchaeota archaeon]